MRGFDIASESPGKNHDRTAAAADRDGRACCRNPAAWATARDYISVTVP
jgi:hypothetical protein